MKKRIFIMFLLLALAVGLYALNVKADGGAVTVTQAAQASPMPTADNCIVNTGFDGGTVNLRTCAGTYCEVIRILTEGERLNILSAGLWMRVTTKDGVTGYVNSTYCKGK